MQNMKKLRNFLLLYFGYDANGGLCDIVCEYIYLG